MLEIISQQPFLERVRDIGTRIRARLNEWTARKDLIPIANIRGVGAMIGFDIMTSRDSGEPDAATARRVTARALQLGLIILPCGPLGETLRLMPPLTLTDGCLETALNRLEKALETT
jgi:4-aminobutyrate aminotransferase/(S)-3-amino-2-methylpropionate transaminase